MTDIGPERALADNEGVFSGLTAERLFINEVEAEDPFAKGNMANRIGIPCAPSLKEGTLVFESAH